MHGSKTNLAAGSKEVADHSVRSLSDTSSSYEDTDQNGNEWFVNPVNKLYPKDAGYCLHLVTGFEDRTCYRYAAGDRKVPGFFFYTMLRSDHGWQWLCAFMDGSEAAWWKEMQRDRAQASAARAFVRGMDSM